MPPSACLRIFPFSIRFLGLEKVERSEDGVEAHGHVRLLLAPYVSFFLPLFALTEEKFFVYFGLIFHLVCAEKKPALAIIFTRRRENL